MQKALDLDPASDARIWAQLGKVRPPIETSETLPAVCYSDPAFFAREQRAIFHRSWIAIGRADRWQATGDYSALDLAGVPTIVLRDKAGVLRAFANTCRHRGMPLLEGEGRVRAISCPFHNWTYRLDGSLRAAPRIDRQPGFDKESMGLVPFRLETRDGFAFVCFDETAPSLDQWLGDFSALHAPWSLGELVTTHRRAFEVACNWKPFLEVFSEWYHLPFVHSKSIDSLYAKPDPGGDVEGRYASQFGETEGRGGLLEKSQDQSFPMIRSLQGRNRMGGRYTWVYPNLVFSANPDALWAYEAHPIAADRTRIVFSFCFPRETLEEPDFEARAACYYERIETALAEDIPILERQHKGLSTRYDRPGRYCTALEPIVANFACWYAETMLAGRQAPT